MPCVADEIRLFADLEMPSAAKLDRHDLLDLAGPRRHHDHAVRQEHRFADRMGDENDRLAFLARQQVEVEADLIARDGVERAERLVHQQEAGIVDQRPHDRGALVHAAGEFVGKAVGELAKADALKQTLRAFFVARLVEPAHFDLQHHVVEDGAPAEHQMLLEHDAELVHRAVYRLAKDCD